MFIVDGMYDRKRLIMTWMFSVILRPATRIVIFIVPNLQYYFTDIIQYTYFVPHYLITLTTQLGMGFPEMPDICNYI